MKSKNRFLKSVIGFLAVVLTLVGCMDNNYYSSKVGEILYIQNGTDSTIYVEYGFLRTINPYMHRVRDSIPRSMSTLYRFDDLLINGLWMSEKDFNAYVSKIRIYKLSRRDTTFVAPHYYNTKSVWIYKYNDPLFYQGWKQNSNELTILPTMFNH
jgi:hypothetical protein